MKFIVALCLLLAMQAQNHEKAPEKTPEKTQEKIMHAKGTFDVKVTPQRDENGGDSAVGRFALDKQFHGDLEGTSQGQMLAFGNPGPNGSAGYVAMERVTGALNGHKGSFALMHSGTMDRGALELKVTVVPGSGTGELSGLSGTMKIDAGGGKHSYEFEYTQ